MNGNAYYLALATAVLVTFMPLAAQGLAKDDMARIDGGAYTIGKDDAGASARPAHRVAIAPFLIDRFEVSNADFVRFLTALDVRVLRDKDAGTLGAADVEGPDTRRLFEGASGTAAYIALGDSDALIGTKGGRFAPRPGFARHPVTEVTWYGAVAYCRWRGTRLPTEVEWEAAARGKSGRSYPWGEAAPSLRRAKYGRENGATKVVDGLPDGATPESIHHMAGNLAEWTSSLYRPYPYDAGDGREDPTVDGERVTRGGDYEFDTAPEKMAGFFRAGYSRRSDRGHRHIGFRCARNL